MLAPGDLLMTAAGATIGKSYLHFSAEPACYAGYLVRFRADAGSDPRFVAYWMQSTDYWAQIESGAVRSTIDNFSAGKYRNLLVPQPPLTEQWRIADFLDDQVTRIHEVVSLRRRQLELLRAQMSAIAYEQVTGGSITNRIPSHLLWAPLLPAAWPVARLSTIAEMGSGHTPSRSQPEYWLDCDIPWLTTGDVHLLRDDEIEFLSETEIQISQLGLGNSAAVLHPAGTVALSRTASAGFSVVMGIPMATSQDFVVWRPSPLLDSIYLLWCLRAMRRDLLGRLAMGSTHKTIYFPDLESVRVPLPPLEDQRIAVASIRHRTTSIVAMRKAIRESVVLLEERKRALITAAVTGELDVSTASARAAAAVTG